MIGKRQRLKVRDAWVPFTYEFRQGLEERMRIVLSLLLLAAVATAQQPDTLDGFSPPKGLRWGMSYSEVVDILEGSGGWEVKELKQKKLRKGYRQY